MAAGKVFQSSNLQKVIDYNSDTNSLVLEFVNGHRYQYSGVPFWVYHALIKSNNPGEFFAKSIRTGYKYVKLSS